jgi:hypothetical protein
LKIAGRLAAPDAPALRAERDELDATLRGAVLDSGDVELIWRFTQHRLTQ